MLDLEKELKDFPDGNLFATKNGKYSKYYLCNGRHPLYIKKRDQALAQVLTLKRFKTLQYEEKNKELKLLNDLLPKCQFQGKTSSDMLNEKSLYFNLLQSQLQDFPLQLRFWYQEDYERSQNHPEHLIHKTLAGHLVRSKSEVLIANSLFLKHIPYRYECALHLGEVKLFPDFTILHPSLQTLYYFEHFGMMDNPAYRDSAFNKLKLYGNHNIIPGINLLTTYETQAHPISSEEIDHLIKRHFLT
ncbi:MAG: hypothetical protein PHS82_05750 [Lachnospiraceae bacterium]|nr:hypothetical protein [Lachnospiraceae bacterium]